MKLTSIIPCYNEEEALPFFYREIKKVAGIMPYADFELLFVDDGSEDRTLEILKNLAEKDERIKYISFSRNFGKEAAIYAGLENASGDLVVIMDADLQDPPSFLPEMYQAITQEGFDSVATRRVTRAGEPLVRSYFARIFYRIINKISKTEIVDGARDYRMMNRRFVNALLDIKEYCRFSKGLFGWAGFRTKWLEYENSERVAGKTKWSFWKLFLYSIEGIVAFSTGPLAIASVFGVLMLGIGGMAIIFIIIRQLLFGGSAFGWSSLVCIILLVSGLQLFCTGILGVYLSKTYLEVKNRPIYIIGEENIRGDKKSVG